MGKKIQAVLVDFALLEAKAEWCHEATVVERGRAGARGHAAASSSCRVEQGGSGHLGGPMALRVLLLPYPAVWYEGIFLF